MLSHMDTMLGYENSLSHRNSKSCQDLLTHNCCDPRWLKQLIMSFTMPDDVKPEHVKDEPAITHVGLQYGLKLVPEVNITFLYDYRRKNANLIRKELEPASQFVKFGHHDEEECF